MTKRGLVIMVGGTGSGKSTLIKCLGVLMTPSAGGVILNDYEGPLGGHSWGHDNIAMGKSADWYNYYH